MMPTSSSGSILQIDPKDVDWLVTLINNGLIPEVSAHVAGHIIDVASSVGLNSPEIIHNGNQTLILSWYTSDQWLEVGLMPNEVVYFTYSGNHIIHEERYTEDAFKHYAQRLIDG